MNAILRRELLALMRTRTAIATQIVLAAITAMLVVLRWPTEGAADLAGIRSLQVMRTFGYCLLAVHLTCHGLAFPAISLVSEKNSVGRSRPALLNTPLSFASDLRRQTSGSAWFCRNPFIDDRHLLHAACYALGGTSRTGGVILLYLILATAIVQIATVGLLVSSRAQSIDGALRATYPAPSSLQLFSPSCRTGIGFYKGARVSQKMRPIGCVKW